MAEVEYPICGMPLAESLSFMTHGIPISLPEVFGQKINERSYLCRQMLAVGIESVDLKLLWQKVAKNSDQSARFQIINYYSNQ